MTESDWRACADPQPMLEFLGARPSERKLRLFGCACCRRVWHLLDDVARQGVELAERYADGQARLHDLVARRTAIVAKVAPSSRPSTAPDAQARWTVYSLLSNRIAETLGNVHVGAAEAAANEADRAGGRVGPARVAFYDEAVQTGTTAQAELLRHLIQPFPGPATSADWPGQVTQLADALYHGADCGFALHDALLDSGHPDLAEHFRDREHPRGCWVVDLLLGKG